MDKVAAIKQKMWENDHFSQWLGLDIQELDATGYCKLQYTVRKDMLNGFGTIQGGALFSAADTAFAFACNVAGDVTVALDVNISFLKPAHEGDVLTVEARKMHQGRKTGLYEVKTFNAKHELISFFKGTCYVTGKSILDTEDDKN